MTLKTWKRVAAILAGGIGFAAGAVVGMLLADLVEWIFMPPDWIPVTIQGATAVVGLWWLAKEVLDYHK